MNNALKRVFASYMVAVGLSILLIVLGLFLFGYETINPVLENYGLYILLAITIAAYPLVKRYMD